MRRFKVSRKGALEGLPLYLIIMVIIAAVGIAILVGWMYMVKKPELDHIVLTTHEVTYDPDTSTVTPSDVTVTAYDTSGKTMEGVKVRLEGCGVNNAGVTGKDGTYTFDLNSVSLPTNVHTGEIRVTAEYAGTTLKVVTDVIVVHTP